MNLDNDLRQRVGGTLSGWYAFSALGFYPVSPGSGEYALGSPLVKQAELQLAGGRTFVVEAPDRGTIARIDVRE